MSTDAASMQQQKAREFMSLLPLTLELAGLPKAPTGTYYNEGQIEARSVTVKAAYKIARQVITDVTK
jgi:hypothetical protein